MTALRFLHVTTFYPPYAFGGDAVLVRELSRALARRGHEVHVAHNVDAFELLAPDSPVAPPAAEDGVTVHALRGGLGRLAPLLAHQSGRPWPHRRRLQRLVDGVEPDVIHFHNVSLFGPAVLTLAPRSGRRPVKLYTTHEHWLVCPTHVLWKYGRRPCERPTCLTCTLRAGRPPQLWRHTGLAERSLAHVDRLLAPSRFVMRMHRERGLDGPFVHLPSFVEPAGADRDARTPRPHPRPYFLYVGRLEPIKGVDALVRAWPRLPDDVDLLVVGAGSDEGRLRRAAAGEPRIHVVGARDRDALGAFYAHAVACLVPSAGYEVFPLVVPEALARGTPVLARSLGGLVEMVEESGGGLLFDDEDGLVDALRRLWASPDLRRALGDAGRGFCAKRWSTDAHLDAYLALVEEVAAERAGDGEHARAPDAATAAGR